MKRRERSKKLIKLMREAKSEFAKTRRNAGVTQVELSKATGISQQSISGWETETETVSVPDIAQWRLCMLFLNE